MNPINFGPAAMMAFSNPELFSTAMAAQGVSPSAITNPLVPPGIAQPDPLAAFFTPSMAPQMARPAAPAPVAGVGAPAAPGGVDLMQMLGQVKAPAPVQPIMNAGVSGAQKAPEVQAGASASPAAQMALKLLLNQGGQQGTPVASLPGLMRGL